MKTREYSRLLMLVLFLVGGGRVTAQFLNWSYEDIITDLQQSGANPDLYVEADGDLHISYWKEALNRLTYGYRNHQTGTWAFEDITDEGTYGFKSAITVDGNGHVHIAYLHNDAGIATLKYVSNTSGSWVVEAVNGTQSVGIYGFDLDYPTYVQPSLDIFLQPSGRPAIVYFDGRSGTITPCTPVPQTYINYELDMDMVTKEADGSWLPYAFDPVTYTGGEVCLNGADRAGEFCQILPVGGGQYLGVTPAMHNHELLLYQSVPGDVRNWASMAVDSTARLFNDINFRHFFESFGFVDASLGPDRVLHLVYAVSVSYGNGPITGSFYNNRQPLIYTQVALDSLGDTSYTPHHFTFPVRNRIRSQCGITTVGNDTIFLAYATPSVQEVAVARSIDGGASWEQDTLYKRSVNAPLQVAVVDDSVLVLAYDADRDYLIASRQALTGGDWVHRLVTQTEVRGVHLSSVIARTGNDDKIQIAYTESAEDRVYLATRQAGTWTHEAVSKPGKGVGTVSMVTLAGEPIIAYDQLGDSLLVVAYQDNGAWTEEVIRASVAVGDVKLAANPTDIHLCYYDLTEGGLSYAHRLVGAGAWSHEVVDTSSLIIGQAPDAALDVAGTLHVVYLDVLNAKLRYAQRSPAGAWTLEDVTEAQNYLPAFPSLRLGSNGQPRVAFRNSATNRILFAERDQAGDWSIQTVDSDPSNLLGAPLRLLLDASDRPWVLYNHVTAVNGMRVARRADNGQWTAVSVTNNTAEIGNQFSFHVVEEDLYIIGRKNRLDNNGLGLLYAERGIKTWLEPQMVEASFRMGPNPAQAGHPLRLSFDLPQAREVTIGIYNLQGQCVHLWESEGTLSPGFHRWDAQPEGLAPGLYLVQLRTAQYQVSRRWVVQP